MGNTYNYLYTGADESDIPNPAHRSEVAIALDEEMQKAWRKSGSDVEYINQRIMTIRFRHQGTSYKVISVYAPTFTRPEQEKTNFTTHSEQTPGKLRAPTH